jgi:ribose/xylose/arabinose/galactoside ABC-type transport system permease subunit
VRHRRAAAGGLFPALQPHRPGLTAGGNATAAYYTGINAGKMQFVSFCLSGALAGFCGYLWISRFAVAYVDVANGFELQVVAACVIGGISTMGGTGRCSAACAARCSSASSITPCR